MSNPSKHYMVSRHTTVSLGKHRMDCVQNENPPCDVRLYGRYRQHWGILHHWQHFKPSGLINYYISLPEASEMSLKKKPTLVLFSFLGFPRRSLVPLYPTESCRFQNACACLSGHSLTSQSLQNAIIQQLCPKATVVGGGRGIKLPQSAEDNLTLWAMFYCCYI